MAQLFNLDRKPKRIFALSRAFALQYVSLILIILAAVAGAFTRPNEEEKKTAALPVVEESPAVAPGRKLTEVNYPDFFSADGRISNGAAVYALHSLLKEHDIRVEIELGADERAQGAGEDALQDDFSRAALVEDLFRAAGIPDEAVRVYVGTTGSEFSLSAAVFKEAEANL